MTYSISKQPHHYQYYTLELITAFYIFVSLQLVVLVVEQPKVGVSEDHFMLVRSLDAFLIHHASTRCRKIPYTALPCSVHVIREREERIARARDTIELLRVSDTLFRRKRLRKTLEQALPLCLFTALKNLTAYEEVNSIGFFCTLHAFLEWKIKDAWVVTEPPEISLGTR